MPDSFHSPARGEIVLQKLVQRLLIALFAITSCGLLAGCLSGNPSYFPYLLPAGGLATQTHAKPAGPGYFADFDPHARRIEVRPEITTLPVRSTQVVIATIYDEEGKPRRKRRVEWMLEGPGSIIEVDESGYLPGRGMKVDNKSAYSHTDYFEHTITRGNENPDDDFIIRPGQTWCVITSAVEGQTNLIVYAPEIHDWEKNKVFVKLTWVDAKMQFPPPATTRAGGEHTFTTQITSLGKKSEDYRVRYRIIDGPPAALARGQGPLDSTSEAISDTMEDGAARIRIVQPAPAAGINRVAVEVIKPNPDDPKKFTVVSQNETKITWLASKLAVNIASTKYAPINQDYPVTYSVASTGDIETQSVTMNAVIPEGMQLVSTEPKATVDGQTLIWTFPPLGANKQHTAQAVYKPTRIGGTDLSADARSMEGITAKGATRVIVTEPKLQMTLEGPSQGLIGEAIPYQIIVTNGGDGPAEQIRVKAKTSEGLETADKTSEFNEVIDYLPAGQSKTFPLPLTPKKTGTFSIQAGALGEGNISTTIQKATVSVQEAQLTVTPHGPSRAYVGQEVTWQLVVRNTGDVPLDGVVVKANLPLEMSFVSASDNGRGTGKQVQWDLGKFTPRQEKTISVLGLCEKLSDRATLTASVTAAPMVVGEKGVRTVSMVKPTGSTKPVEAGVEIIGVPALQMTVHETVDPIIVGQRTSYVIRVKNAGSLAAKKVNIVANVPTQMRPLRAGAQGITGTIDGNRITFPAIETLERGAEVTLTVEVEATSQGNARFNAELRSVMLAQPIRVDEPTRILSREARTNNP
jgi:uncharacterized repeat protein (TIGR01451 family)